MKPHRIITLIGTLLIGGALIYLQRQQETNLFDPQDFKERSNQPIFTPDTEKGEDGSRMCKDVRINDGPIQCLPECKSNPDCAGTCDDGGSGLCVRSAEEEKGVCICQIPPKKPEEPKKPKKAPPKEAPKKKPGKKQKPPKNVA